MPMATQAKRWTLAELYRLPDDGNKYELVRGDLFVTPAPSVGHETILACLNEILVPFVVANGLGKVFHPRAVVRFESSEVEPDLMVRRLHPDGSPDWDDAPTPSLVIEVLSDSTRRRDIGEKRQLYIDAGVPEYWIVDPEDRSVVVVRPGDSDRRTTSQLIWTPTAAYQSLVIDVVANFG